MQIVIVRELMRGVVGQVEYNNLPVSSNGLAPGFEPGFMRVRISPPVVDMPSWSTGWAPGFYPGKEGSIPSDGKKFCPLSICGDATVL